MYIETKFQCFTSSSVLFWSFSQEHSKLSLDAGDSPSHAAVKYCYSMWASLEGALAAGWPSLPPHLPGRSGLPCGKKTAPKKRVLQIPHV
jgi:hypothetical protein